MKIKIFGSLLVAALALTTIAEAQTKTPVINMREHNQHQRINHGVNHGQLTRAEAYRLRREEQRLALNKRMAKANGHVSRAERRHLRHEENRLSHNIHRYKHNDLKRY
ncbi:hypothetical protein HH214_05655 [Mucilaginibacter robiniae]|uniref:Uncharacterized protein n=1 Tax=Mucilaginibacter robiniae TaxID=2728022 RepID=A0A7L5E1G6_9SPHI|nr:hypothetical protein [Mucilaginibacter robiniae]QJD95394.1 hypothetical protein HH214_05655 [Mucilaginibacter robiniae]